MKHQHRVYPTEGCERPRNGESRARPFSSTLPLAPSTGGPRTTGWLDRGCVRVGLSSAGGGASSAGAARTVHALTFPSHSRLSAHWHSPAPRPAPPSLARVPGCHPPLLELGSPPTSPQHLAHGPLPVPHINPLRTHPLYCPRLALPTTSISNQNKLFLCDPEDANSYLKAFRAKEGKN